MKDTLFLICPFSNLEGFLRQQFGNENYFMTSMGGVLHTNDADYLYLLNEIIRNEQIEKICVVSDVSCRFIDSVVGGESIKTMPCMVEIKNLLLQNHKSIYATWSIPQRRGWMAELLVQEQSRKIGNAVNMGKLDSLQNAEIVGLVVDKRNNEVTQVNVQSLREVA